MIEAFLATEFGMLLVALWPYLVALASTVFTAVLSIKKVADVINEFRNSNEVKALESDMRELIKENKSLKKDVDTLMIELTKVRPVGWTEDKNKEG